MKPITLTAHDRLQTHSAAALTELELLTVLLGPVSGTNSTSKAAAALLGSAPLQELAWAKPEELLHVPGIGPARAAAITAAFELGRRSAWSPPQRGDRVLAPQRVHELLRHIGHADQEQFHIVCLDVRGRLIRTVLIAQGGLHQCPVSSRDLMRQALRLNAHSIILVHSHPSGAPQPSPDDLALTDHLRAAGDLVGVVVRDHVIIGAEGYYSFVEAGRWSKRHVVATL